MAQVVFHHRDREPDIVEAGAGTSVMRAAVEHGVPGIIGECGGQAMCATCHVYVRDPYLAALPPVSEEEDEMLDCTSAPREANSRLGCQLLLGGNLETVVVDVPSRQV